MPELPQSYKAVVFALAIPTFYFSLVLFGRRLMRWHGVRLGWLYHLFALSLAVYLPAVALGFPWSFLPHLGGTVIVLTAMVFSAVVDRYVWELYFKGRHGVLVPKFLTQVLHIIILAVAVF